MRSQIALNSGSILSASFWAPVLQSQSVDKHRLAGFESTQQWWGWYALQ
ncbi:DUF3772 domain-containing protein [Sodalis sp.]